MEHTTNVYLKVDRVECDFNDDICLLKGVNASPVNGIWVYIGNDGHFFPCDSYTTCDPEIAREDGRRQVVALMNDLGKMTIADNGKLFGYCSASDILNHFSYDEIVETLDVWKKEKEAIRVRDEVYNQSMKLKFVVTKINVPSGGEDAIVNGIKKDGTVIKGPLLHNVKKTGLHVDDLDSYVEV